VSRHFTTIHGQEQLSWRILSAELFPNGPIDLARAVIEEQCWVAIASTFLLAIKYYLQIYSVSQSRSHK
jgi:hypothetical protein